MAKFDDIGGGDLGGGFAMPILILLVGFFLALAVYLLLA
jgi:hypothetical protein